MESKRAFTLAWVTYALLMAGCYYVGVTLGYGEAEGKHDPSSLLMYVRRLVMIGLAIGLPILAAGVKVRGYGWTISFKWLVISIFLVGIPIGWFNRGGFVPTSVLAILLALFHTFATELYFRAYLIKTFERHMKGFWGPVLLSSLMYGVSYLTVHRTWQWEKGWQIGAFVLGFTVLGILYGALYKKSGSFLVPFIAHFLGVLKYKELFGTL
ncbi:MAG: CPBP family intramembrane metalloprotease [Deltaproteobacteria bacterium]|nr:CPBP family intramembrane metalloprotease [Deltaproteobacteria bacterium]